MPFGLTTDVSAGALAAGAGGALGAGVAGPVTGDAAPGASVFADALKAAAATGVVATPEGGAAARPGDVKVALPASASEEAIDLLKKAVSDQAAAQPPVPATQPAPLPGTAGADTAKISSDGEAAVADPPGPEDPQIDEGAILASMDAIVPAVPGPAPLPGVTPAGQEAGGAASPSSVPSSAVPPAVGAAGNGVPGGMLPGAPGGQQPPAVASPNAANGLQQAANAGAGVSGSPAGLEGGTDAAAPAGRRWQNELPPELRASQPQAGQSRANAQPAPVLPASANATTPATAAVVAGNGAAESAVPKVAALAAADKSAAQAPAGTTSNAQPAPLQTQSGQLAPVPTNGQAPVPASGSQLGGQPAAQLPSDLATAAGQASSRPAGPSAATGGSLTAVAATTSGSGTPSVLSAEAPVTVQTGEVLPDAALPDAPVADDVATLAKPGADTGAPGNAAKPAGVATTQAGQGADNRAANTPAVTAPVAAATTLAVVAEDAGLPVTDPDTMTGSDFTTASVRGGDLHGAMRTESLQTPNQTQSAHVATQVAAEIARNLKDGNTRFQMRFDPPELGRVEVNMRVGADGSVQAHLIVDRPETLDMFLRDQRGLERALEAAGLNPDSDNLQFSLKQDGGQQFASDQGDGGQQSGFGDNGSEGSGDADPDITERVRLMLAEQRGGLDMKV
nr:flagellar hook-length control protein FliK [Roseibium sp. CAU 1639]